MKKEFKQELIDLLKETSEKSVELKNLFDSFIEAQQLKCLENLHFTFTLTQNYRNETKYYAARTFLPIGIDEEKSFRVYVGRVVDFEGGIESEELKKVAHRKLTKLIQDYREEHQGRN